MFKNTIRLIITVIGLICAASAAKAPAQISDVSYPVSVENAVDSVVTILLGNEGNAQVHPVGSGLVVRSDGYILTAHHLIRNARDIKIRLRNGEIYDKAEIVSTDERRNVALLRVAAVGLRSIPNGTAAEESQVGSRVFVVANPAGGQSLIDSNGLLNAVQMADAIAGGGKGYRVLQLNSGSINAGENYAGGLVLDERGRSLGIVTSDQNGLKDRNVAVPLSSVYGLIRAVGAYFNASPSISSIPVSPTPVPIPQNSVQVPQRGVLPLAPKGPGSVVVKPTTPKDILAASKTIYVASRTMFFKPDQMVNALLKRKEIADWGLTFVDEREVADLILELDHVVFTFKYTFKIYSQRIGGIIATGDVIIWDGNLGADWMAKRVVEKMTAVRAAPDPPKVDKGKDK